MSDPNVICETDFFIPDAEKLITEDDTPVDNFASAKQQRLLVSSLYSSITEKIFLAEANVGIFYNSEHPAIVPDIFLSLNVRVPASWWEKQNRSYMIWKFGKPPELVIEIVSNTQGNELKEKLVIYEQMRVSYYVVYDPNQELKQEVLQIFELKGNRYFKIQETYLEQIELGLTLWQGEFEQRQDTWLRWCDASGNILLTGDERANNAEQRAVNAEQRALQLAERLRSLGVDPDNM